MRKGLVLLMGILLFLLPLTNQQALAKEEADALSTKKTKKIEKLIGGYDFSIVELENGSLWAWGANEYGQLGVNDNENRVHPVKLDTELAHKEIVKLAAGDQNAYALTSDGLAYIWGKNVSGSSSYKKPTKLSVNFKVRDITWTGVTQAANNHSSYVLLSEAGKVYMFGSSYVGTRGRGLTNFGSSEKCTRDYNVRVSDLQPVLTTAKLAACASDKQYQMVQSGTELTDVKLVSGATNAYYYVAITEDNSIYTWGEGYTLTAHKNVNSDKIKGNIVKVIANKDQMYALTDKKEVWEWNGKDGTPTRLENNNVTDIVGNDTSLIVLLDDGKVYGKGNNDYGQLGNTTNTSQLNYLEIKDIKSIGLGYRHALFMRLDDEVFGMGWNSYRQLANEDDGVLEYFRKIDTLTNVDHIAANEFTSYGIKDNQLYAWGELLGGDLGTTTNHPKKISQGDFSEHGEILNIKGSPNNFLQTSLLTSDGNVYTWGHQWRLGIGHAGAAYTIGQLVHNPKNNAYTKNKVNGDTYIVEDSIDIDEIKLIDAVQGNFNGVAVDKTGALLSWGYNASDVWGVGTTQLQDYGTAGIEGKNSTAFIKVKSDETYQKVDGRNRTRLALSENGEVYSWGQNTNGSLGRTGNHRLPLKVENVSNIKEISMGSTTGLALREGGDVFAWGTNSLGQVGNGSTNQPDIPVNITYSMTDKFADVHSGSNSMYGITTQGELYAWGDNRYGQLGLNDRNNRTSPRKVAAFPAKVIQVASGREHTLVLLENGDVYVAGNDAYGQLGRNIDKNIIDYTVILFPDYVEFTTADNMEVELNKTFDIKGNVTSKYPNQKVKVTYDIESSNGKIESGDIIEYMSSTSKKEFTLGLLLDNKYKLGGYTVNVYVENIETGLTNKGAINFGILDTTDPTEPTIKAPTEWANTDVSVSIISGTDDGSGVDYTEYRLNDGDWTRYENPFTISENGETLVEARTIDNAANRSTIAKKIVKVDKEHPSLELTPSTKNITHEDVIITVKATDNYSGVKRIKDNNGTWVNEREFPFVAKENGIYTFIAEDNAENIQEKSITIDIIDKTLSLAKPVIDDFPDVTIGESKTVSTQISPVIVKDWRDGGNDWEIGVSASTLKQVDSKYTLPVGSLLLNPINKITKIEGKGENPSIQTTSTIPIDDGRTILVKGNNARGEYHIVFPNDVLEVVIDPTIVKKGRYESTITWELISAP